MSEGPEEDFGGLYSVLQAGADSVKPNQLCLEDAPECMFRVEAVSMKECVSVCRFEVNLCVQFMCVKKVGAFEGGCVQEVHLGVM